jgi:hypothetical protein
MRRTGPRRGRAYRRGRRDRRQRRHPRRHGDGDGADPGQRGHRQAAAPGQSPTSRREPLPWPRSSRRAICSGALATRDGDRGGRSSATRRRASAAPWAGRGGPRRASKTTCPSGPRPRSNRTPNTAYRSRGRVHRPVRGDHQRQLMGRTEARPQRIKGAIIRRGRGGRRGGVAAGIEVGEEAFTRRRPGHQGRAAAQADRPPARSGVTSLPRAPRAPVVPGRRASAEAFG